MNKSRKSFKILLMLVLLCCLSCGKQQVKELEIKNDVNSKIKDINFPKDLLFEKGRLYNLEKPKQKTKVISGHYYHITDIFNNGKYVDNPNELTKYKVFYNLSNGNVTIYDEFQYQLNGDCSDCNPLFDCFYFDGRYAVLTQEDGYRRIILDKDAEITFLVDYNEEEKGSIRNVIYLDKDLNPTFFINQNDEKLSFFEINDRKKKEIIFAEFEAKNKNNLNYTDIIKIHKLFSEKNFKTLSSINNDDLPNYFFP